MPSRSFNRAATRSYRHDTMLMLSMLSIRSSQPPPASISAALIAAAISASGSAASAGSAGRSTISPMPMMTGERSAGNGMATPDWLCTCL
jgi:hypothetical protein